MTRFRRVQKTYKTKMASLTDRKDSQIFGRGGGNRTHVPSLASDCSLPYTPHHHGRSRTPQPIGRRHTERAQPTWPFGSVLAFSPSSVHFKGEISGGFPRTRHQKRHSDFCTPCLTSRRSQVRALHCAPLFSSFLRSNSSLAISAAESSTRCRSARSLVWPERIRLLRLRTKRRRTDNQKFVVLSVCLEFHFVFINLELDRGIGWYDRLILRLRLPNLIFSRRCMYDVLLANYIRRGFLSFVLRTAVDGLLRDDCASHGSRAGQRREAVKDGSGERPSLAFHCLLPLELSSQTAEAKCHLPTILLQAYSFYSLGHLRQGPNAPIRVTVMLPRRNVSKAQRQSQVVYARHPTTRAHCPTDSCIRCSRTWCLPAAGAYAQSATAVPHALHVASHIFTRRAWSLQTSSL